jgi:hypothetical protein
MPQATTCGTVGYTSHLAWNSGQPDPRKTWCEHADRYALALLNTEFLMLRPGAKMTGEGGLFDEKELRNQRGRGINTVMTELTSKYPGAQQLLNAAIHASSFSNCPSPQQWSSLCDTMLRPSVPPPGLDEFPQIPPRHFEDILKKRRRSATIWPAPSLEEMKLKVPKKPAIWIPTFALPWDLQKKKH